jgi:hypothetical protein
LSNADEQRVVSFERTSGNESFVVVINLSSSPFAGIVNAGAGTFQDVTPDWQAGTKDAQGAPIKWSAATLPAVYLAPWEFRVFSRSAK